jgi:hypothetical protein
VGAKEGIDILPLCSRGIIVKVFANVFFKIGKPQCDMLAAARASPAFQRYVPQRKRAPEVQELLSLKQIMITRHYYPNFVGLPKPLTAQLVATKELLLVVNSLRRASTLLMPWLLVCLAKGPVALGRQLKFGGSLCDRPCTRFRDAAAAFL